METKTIVSRCSASQCRFNQDQNCTAGQIEVSVSAEKAECLTFSPRAEGAAQQDRAQQ
ncbi:DUF1540 domain-containing protein [Deinococcus lacus]|uniref:DUF1540 domain-containing protein n=1 Tax=Deinococcus lacus TaxID=392561 RepID=A0ABW1YEF5_9DEIO